MPDFAVDESNFAVLLATVTSASSSATEVAPSSPDVSGVCEDFGQDVTDFAETWSEESAACARYLRSFRAALEQVDSSIGHADTTMAGDIRNGAS